MSVSERLTARAEHDRCALALAKAAGAVLVRGTTGDHASLFDALREFTDARRVLDG